MQCSVATEPEAIAKALAPFAATLKRAGHKAGVTGGAIAGSAIGSGSSFIGGSGASNTGK